MSTAFVLLAGAVLLWPGRRTGLTRTPAPHTRDRRTQMIAGVATVALCLVLLGPARGLPAALVAGPAVMFSLRRASVRPVRAPADLALPLALDLAAAVLRSGRPVSDALRLAAPTSGPATAAALRRTARLLELGADPAAAWSGGDAATPSAEMAVLAPVAEVAVRSHASGVRMADAFERLAADLRTERTAAGVQRAQRAGVAAMGPLAACFLPSFICLGIVPVIAGIAANVLNAVT